MKKTFLTLVAIAFGSCVAFAQTTPQTEEPAVNTEEGITIDRLSNTAAAAEVRMIDVEELPAAVQEALLSEQFQHYTVVALAEVQNAQGADSPGTFYQAALADSSEDQPSLIVLFDERGKVLDQEAVVAEEEQE